MYQITNDFLANLRICIFALVYSMSMSSFVRIFSYSESILNSIHSLESQLIINLQLQITWLQISHN